MEEDPQSSQEFQHQQSWQKLKATYQNFKKHRKTREKSGKRLIREKCSRKSLWPNDEEEHFRFCGPSNSHRMISQEIGSANLAL
jgi:ferredoxin-NADP reductase